MTGVHWWRHPLSIHPRQAGLFCFNLGNASSMAEKKLGMDKEWTEAARRCRLSAADVHMAKELGFKPRSLLKNVPSPQQPWKAPVAEWVRELYARRQRRTEQRRRRRETANTASLERTVAAPTMRADF